MRISSGLFVAALLTAGTALSACAPVMHVRSYTETGSDLRRYQTYAFAPPDRQATGDPRLDDNRFFNERVQQDVEQQLASRGFKKVNAGAADLVVHHHASVSQQLELNDVARPDCYYRMVNGIRNDVPSGNCRPYVYDAGTLLIDLVDRKTNKVVWRGWAEGSIDGVLENQQWMEERIDKAVTRIMAKLPARPATAN